MAKRVYLIAGEASGDVIGGELMKALKAVSPDIAFTGLGGDRMQNEGLHSLFDIKQIAVMGFAEVLPHIPRLRARIKETIADILEKKPDMLITIDSPGFTFRVVKALKKQGFNAPCVHYVAPTCGV
jgi:Lipid A disaccharide synthetase